MDVLLALQPEELGPVILKLAAARMQNGMFNAQQVLTVPAARGMTATQVTPYAADKEREVNVAPLRSLAVARPEHFSVIIIQRLLEERYVKSRQKLAFSRQSSFGRLLSVGVDVNGSVCICPGAVIFLSNHNVASQKINKSG